MTENCVRRFLFVALAAFVGRGAVLAQNSTSSPYSMFGVGVLTLKEDASSTGLGHAGIALAPAEWVNIANPAAINNLDSLTFYFNIQVKAFYAKEKTDFTQQSVYSANIDGVTMAFRAKKWWCAAIGYAPYSTIGYHMTDKKFINGYDGTYDIVYSGSGGMSQAFLNNAFTLFRHVSLGVGVGVLWGSATKTETSLFSEAVGGEDIYNTRKYTMNNLFFEYGLQFDFNLGQNNFRFGAVFNDKRKLYSSYDQYVYNNISSNLFHDDVTPLADQFYVPRTYGAGLTFSRKHMLGTLDFKIAEWGGVENVKFKETARYKDCYSVNGGFQFAPGNPTDPFYKRMRYRIGGFYNSGNVEFQGYTLEDYGFTLGLTVPMGRWTNAVTIAFERLHRGTVVNGLVEEKFNNFKIAINIRETWFMKSRFD